MTFIHFQFHSSSLHSCFHFYIHYGFVIKKKKGLQFQVSIINLNTFLSCFIPFQVLWNFHYFTSLYSLIMITRNFIFYKTFEFAKLIELKRLILISNFKCYKSTPQQHMFKKGKIINISNFKCYKNLTSQIPSVTKA